MSETNLFLHGKIQAVTFEIEGQIYGVDISLLDEILLMLEVKTLHKSPSFIRGVINLRGEVIPVVDLREQLGCPQLTLTFETRIMVSTFKNCRVGFIVDGVREVKEIAHEKVEDEKDSEAKNNFVVSIAKLEDGRLIQLIAMDRILDETMLQQLSELKVGKPDSLHE